MGKSVNTKHIFIFTFDCIISDWVYYEIFREEVDSFDWAFDVVDFDWVVCDWEFVYTELVFLVCVLGGVVDEWNWDFDYPKY